MGTRRELHVYAIGLRTDLSLLIIYNRLVCDLDRYIYLFINYVQIFNSNWLFE